MKKIIFITLLISVLFSCKETKIVNQEIRGEAQGTTFYISYSDSLQRDFSKEISKILLDFDEELSIYFYKSLLFNLNNNSLKEAKDFMFFGNCLYKSVEIESVTNGAFNHGMKNIIDFTKDKTSFSAQDSLAVDSILKIDHRFIIKKESLVKLDKRAKFDFNAIAQGYSVDVLGDFLESKGVKNYMVEIGGELKVKGRNQEGEKWSVGLESPKSTVTERDFQEIIYLENKALATSGSYRKFKEINGKKYSHVIDPGTGYGVTHNLLSVTVIANDCMTADALATAFLVMGKEKTISFLKEKKNSDELDGELKTISVFFIETNEKGEFVTSYFNGFEKYLTGE